MQTFKWSGKRNDVALGGSKITLQLLRELADLIPADCVGPIIGAALKIIEIIEARFTSNRLRSLIYCNTSRERRQIPVTVRTFSNA